MLFSSSLEIFWSSLKHIQSREGRWQGRERRFQRRVRRWQMFQIIFWEIRKHVLQTRGKVRLGRSYCGRSNVLESTNFRFCQEMRSFWNVNRMRQARITCERGRSNVLESTNFRFCQEPQRLNLSSFIVQPEAKASLSLLLVGKFSFGSNLRTLITAARTRNCGARMRVEKTPPITQCQQVKSVQRVLSKGQGRVVVLFVM